MYLHHLHLIFKTDLQQKTGNNKIRLPNFTSQTSSTETL